MVLLVTGAWVDAQNEISKLEEMGHRVLFLKNETDMLPCDPEQIEGVICNGLFLHHPIEKFHNLRYIQLTSAGYDRIPMEYVKAHNIEIHNAGDVYSIPMAEYALCGVLQLYKKSSVFLQQQKQHIWQKQRNIRELSGKTVCIIGCGHVGKACAKRFSAFDAKVIGVNRTVAPMAYFDNVVSLERLDDVLVESDIVILSIALTKETNCLLNRARLSKVKDGAVIVNIARGNLIDTEALIELLQTKKVLGAVLDVFAEEPLPMDSPMWDLENVVITPHNSFVGQGNANRLKNVIITDLKRR